jgi:starch-binding outer membrane protein, SusD/RagB family
MKSPKIFKLLLAACMVTATSCEKDLLEKTNPNAPTTDQFWKTADDATKGVFSCYSGIQQYACYGHSWQFMTFPRSDEAYSQSPFVELAIFTRFLQPSNNFFISAFAWNDYYRTIYRTNQVLTRVPDISMDATLKARLLGETRFIRALMYYDLAYLFGNVPLIITESTSKTRPPQATQEQVMAQVIADLQAAIPDLPLTYGAADKGRVTKGAAQAMLAKAYLMQHKYSEASALFAEVISSGQYSLVPEFSDNFTEANENNAESLFEVQYTGSVAEVGQGQDNSSSSEGYDRPNFFGPPGVTFSDVQPRQWLLDNYRDSTTTFAPGSTTRHEIDPRRDASIFSAISPVLVYGISFTDRGYNPSQLYWRKYQNDRTRTNEVFNSGINFRIIRYADVLLMQAEALNELGQTAAALPLVNQVRARVNLAPLPTMSQNALRIEMRNERARELCGEGTRWFDIVRWGLLDNQAGIDDLKTRDSDFENFVIGKSALLPIPQNDLDIDPNMRQNPGW